MSEDVQKRSHDSEMNMVIMINNIKYNQFLLLANIGATIVLLGYAIFGDALDNKIRVTYAIMDIILGVVSFIEYYMIMHLKKDLTANHQQLKHTIYIYVFFLLIWTACLCVLGFYQGNYAYLIINCAAIYGSIIAIVIKPKIFFLALGINAGIISIGAILSSYEISSEVYIIFTIVELVAVFISIAHYDAKVAEYDNISLMENQSVQLEKLNNELKVASRIDALTGLYNRVYLKEYINLFWEKCRDCHHVLTVVMVDIDDFKPINDRFGHDFGDGCLVTISNLLKERVSNNGGTAFRYGGEEFLFIFPKVESADVVKLMLQIKEDLTQLDFHAMPKITITASFGVCEMIPNSDITFQDIVRNADDMLYSVKKHGKNNVFEYNSPIK